MNNEEQFRNEDEIDLAELVGVLFRRWRCIVYITILALVITSFYLVIQNLKYEKSNKYKFESIVQIGQFSSLQGGYQFIEKPESVRGYLESFAKVMSKKSKKYFNKKSLGFSVEGDLNVNVNSDTGIINILLTASKDSKAKLFIGKMTNELLRKHNKIYNDYSEKNKNVKDMIDSYNKYIVNLSKTQILLSPTTSNNPIPSDSINYKIYVSISLILGLFLGIFTAFLREFWVMNRDKILGRENH